MAADAVALAAHAFVFRAFEVLRERCPGKDDEPMEMGVPQWREDSGEGLITKFGDATIFRLTPDVREPERVCAAREVGVLAGERPEYAELSRAFEADPIIGPRIGNQVVGGAGLGGGGWQVLPLVMELVDEIIRTSGGLSPDADIIREAIERAVRYLRRESEVVTTLAPLSDFSSEAATISLGDGFEIGLLTSEEISAALALGGRTVSFFEPNPIFGRGGLTMMVPPTWAIRTTYEVPIRVGGGTGEEIEATVQARSDATGQIDDVVRALRLFKRGRVGVHSVVTIIPSLFYGPPHAALGGPTGRVGQGRVAPYELPIDEVQEFVAFNGAFRTARSNSVLDTASRRFADASDRGRPDDETVDLSIAAESLFLRKDEQGELTFRVSTRAALFADADPQARRQILEFVSKAYGARSRIVHTGVFDETKLRTLAGEQATPAEFANDFEDLIRAALKKAVRLIESGEPFPPGWDELLFPD